MGHIKAYYEQITAISQADWQYISAQFERVRFLKGEVLTEKGDIERFLYFIECGVLRYYIPDDDGELTFGFCFSKEFASAYDSLLMQSPSTYRLQALADTIAWRISHDGLQKVYAKTQIGNVIGRYTAERLFLAKNKRELELLRQTAKERYLNLFAEQPEIIKRIPLKYIASYIGITPQALSRIRRQIC
ncbi:Crp/Fnr family transcriptional regulator [Parapedobacter sp. ISTM3]|uniref:cAMP-binding domain of CRP or a regulatory subunit of cAMP-dependent protein kinases n=1 Tax=Parapedobacter luteus TaxID=623280 RepID=A0A1T5APF2_9SPHI|nr:MULTISPECIES: Crp/Fnr family transcriptional regulator [Parapedobacter]MBK1441923.1 Crp/Fnr family transcriptional regulator [Parapedobacter sp. ISTM3]SKB36680.1 cAMP-binding domain of CRP or a regulatory subunit of cAMP-dependent protein kinases [Parapedobacter luteus]